MESLAASKRLTCQHARSVVPPAPRSSVCRVQRGQLVKRRFSLEKAAEKLKQSLDFNKNGRIEVIDKLYRYFRHACVQ